MRQVFQEETAKRLEAVARLTINQLDEDFSWENRKEINEICKASGKKTETRITIIDRSGRVLGDSEIDPSRLENHGTRPELAGALAGRVAVISRYSNTFQRNMIYVAVPIEKSDSIIGAARCGVPVTTIQVISTAFNKRIIWGGLIITFLATMISLIIFNRLSRPLRDLREGAERFARGEFNVKIAVPDSEEIGALAESMNLMAHQLNERISSATQQRKEQEALFSSMIEGVLAVDADERIININRAAARLFNIDTETAIKKSVYEIIRHAEFLDFVVNTLASPAAIEQEITIQAEPEKVLQAHGSVMVDAEGKRVGAVIVLNDVTDLKKLENIRRDFVANVSHELKTPITSIKGFVETLIDGAIDDSQEARRFLDIIVRQADRLNSIVDDLLTLSRIEKEYERGEIELRPQGLWEILSAAGQVCEPSARLKDIK
ncbi:MAG: histidine kinase dimerization/phospho-acceptor domain-containing protein, partial [Candidatus Zixiibacteriota bacterium]